MEDPQVTEIWQAVLLEAKKKIIFFLAACCKGMVWRFLISNFISQPSYIYISIWMSQKNLQGCNYMKRSVYANKANLLIKTSRPVLSLSLTEKIMVKPLGLNILHNKRVNYDRKKNTRIQELVTHKMWVIFPLSVSHASTFLPFFLPSSFSNSHSHTIRVSQCILDQSPCLDQSRPLIGLLHRISHFLRNP